MSADRWGVCPQCFKIEEAKEIELRKRVDSEYGKISPAEYLALVASAQEASKKLDERDFEATLREDFEIYTTEEGMFFVFYYAGCDVCGFAHKFEKKEKVLSS